MGLTGEAANREWLKKNVTATILIYSGLVVLLLPASHYVLGTIPGVPPDSLGLRLIATGWSAAVALAVLFFPRLRAHANAMHFINVLPTVLVIAMLTVNSGTHYISIAAGLLVIVGAQQAFYRVSDLAVTMSIAFFFQAFYSAVAGIFYTRLNLTALAIYASAYVIAFIPAPCVSGFNKKNFEADWKRSESRSSWKNAKRPCVRAKNAWRMYRPLRVWEIGLVICAPRK